VASSGWAYVVPAGALAMLIALLVHPVVGIASMLPAVVIVLLVVPASGPVALFAAAAVLVGVPLTTGIGSRSDLRSATLRAGLSFPVLAAIIVGVFGPRDELLTAVAAGAINGVVTAVAVQGALPFLENLFRLPTVTALLDLADRNHPLLRELEAKALGSYNHSVMVASLTERACRAVGADPLLGSVAALYHDIGKVRQPHFFIENQQGIANPHDELEPEVSAVIIQNHVIDGVEMATAYKLPPEVVACIGSHHGTMLVTYFYEQAVRAAGGDRDAVDEEHFRYKGSKPRSKEAAILLLADCSEATTRSMAMSRGTIPREEIEATVERLLQERIEDEQFAESDLTFRELMTARNTIVDSLVGIYHPRIAYPGRGATGGGRDDEAA
jgi:cyclic-di-AMP phosphodiesterase PgpH